MQSSVRRAAGLARGLTSLGAIVLLVIAFTRASRGSGVPDDSAQALEAIARASFDWDHHAEVESGENSAAAERPFYSDVSHAGPVWLLRQRDSNRSEWHRYGLVAWNRRVYFASLDPKPTLLGAGCAECHANGPRAIRGELRSGAESDRLAMNDIIATVHVTPLYYPSSEPAPRVTAPLDVLPCMTCHDGRHRSRLTDFNHRAIRYQVEHASAPPHDVFTVDERRLVLDWLNHH